MCPFLVDYRHVRTGASGQPHRRPVSSEVVDERTQQGKENTAMDAFGGTMSEVFAFHGSGKVSFGEGESRSATLHLTQFEDGTITITCERMSAAFPITEPVAVAGEIAEGGRFKTTGEVGVMPQVGEAARSERLVLICQQAVITHAMASACKPTHARFALVNFPFGNELSHPGTYSMGLGEYHVIIRPVEEYEPRRKQLGAAWKYSPAHRITHTAWMEMSAADGGALDMEAVLAFIGDALLVVSLAVGTNVNWMSYETTDATGTLKTVLRNGYTRPFSDLCRNQRLQVDVEDLLVAWASRAADSPFKMEDLKPRIAQYLNACEPEEYLETSGLVSGTLLDVLTRSYAKAKAKSGLSFRQRLDLLNTNEDILEEADMRERIKETRNNLVHEGTFVAQAERDQQVEFLSILWACHSILVRMIGYAGNVDIPYRVHDVIIAIRRQQRQAARAMGAAQH